MDTEKLKDNITNLTPGKDLSSEAVLSAINLAGQEMAWLIDIPELNFSGTVTVVANTVSYDIAPTTGETIDRITSAVYNDGTDSSVLNEVDIRTFDHEYRTDEDTGTPYEFAFYEKKLWLYYIPDSSGTVYYRAQSVFNNWDSLAENYQPLAFQLTKRIILTSLISSDPGRYNAEVVMCNKMVDRFIKTFKGRVRPYKASFELDPYRAYRMKGLSERY